MVTERPLVPDGHEPKHAVGDAEDSGHLCERLGGGLEVNDVVDTVLRVLDLVRETLLAPLVDLHDDAFVTRDDLFGAIKHRGSFLILHVGAQDKNQLIAVQFGSPPTVIAAPALLPEQGCRYEYYTRRRTGPCGPAALCGRRELGSIHRVGACYQEIQRGR